MEKKMPFEPLILQWSEKACAESAVEEKNYRVVNVMKGKQI